MNLLLLAGNNYLNKEWIYNVKDTLSPLFDKCLVHEYAHWQSGEANINFENEQIILSDESANIDNYCIFAKSIGSILTFKSIAEGIVFPKKCFIIGLPLATIKADNMPLKKWLSINTVPFIIIQNTNDPQGSFKEVRQYLSNLNIKTNFKIFELPGDDHKYNDLSMLKNLINDFVKE